jgi:hypothetical protein
LIVTRAARGWPAGTSVLLFSTTRARSRRQDARDDAERDERIDLPRGMAEHHLDADKRETSARPGFK